MARRARSRARSRAAARRSSVFALSMAVKLATNTWRVPLSVGIPACVTSPAKRSAVPDEGCNHLSSDVIRCHQMSSEVIRGHQRYAIRGMQSEVCNQRSSELLEECRPIRSFQIRSTFQIRSRQLRARDYPWAKSPCRPQRRSHLHAGGRAISMESGPKESPCRPRDEGRLEEPPAAHAAAPTCR